MLGFNTTVVYDRITSLLALSLRTEPGLLILVVPIDLGLVLMVAGSESWAVAKSSRNLKNLEITESDEAFIKDRKAQGVFSIVLAGISIVSPAFAFGVGLWGSIRWYYSA